jgi:hypothetical protein
MIVTLAIQTEIPQMVMVNVHSSSMVSKMNESLLPKQILDFTPLGNWWFALLILLHYFLVGVN